MKLIIAYVYLFAAFAFGVAAGHDTACADGSNYSEPQFPTPPQRVIVQPYVPPGGSIVQRPMGSDYDVTTPYCDQRYASQNDPCVPRGYHYDGR